MLAYIYHGIFRVEGGEVGDYLKYSPVAAKNFLWCWGNEWKKQYSLKMFINIKYQFIQDDKNIVCVTSNQPSVPCFRSHKTSRLPTNHRLLLHVALVYSTFVWLSVFLTEISLIC